MDYKNLNDYELVYQVRENDEIAYNLLIKKYSNLVSMLAKKYLRLYKNIGLEYDDLFQEGMLGIIKALNDYDTRSTIFYTYASLCAKREMDKLIKTQTRKKRMILNECVSINGFINDNQDLVLEDAIPSKFDLAKEYECFDIYQRMMKARFNFNLIDSSILELKINGFSLSEIAELLDLTYKKVDYRMRKIRKILVNYT